MTQKHPFETEAFVDEPGIVGAVWWNTALAEVSVAKSRRTALLVGAGAVVAMVGIGSCVAAVGNSGSGTTSTPAFHEEPRKSLEMQREYGWNFGSPSENLNYGSGVEPIADPTALVRITRDLEPSTSGLAPFYIPTLFQALDATPNHLPPDGVTTSVPTLRESIRPILTSEMQRAEAVGRKLGEFLSEIQEPTCVVVDLAGPSAVAFAAGASKVCDVVFLFDNWPHPKGVVPAHLTLAAAVHYQSDIGESRTARARAKHAVFVLDSARLSPYSNEATQFDNRYLAKLPGVEAARKRGFRHVLHVIQSGAARIEEDVASVLRTWSSSTTDVRLISLSAFDVSGVDATFGGSAKSDAFYAIYPWKAGAKKATADLMLIDRQLCKREYPTAAVGPSLPQSGTVGMVPVIIGGAGIILGAKILSGGSWSRAEGSSWGGG